MLEGRSDEVIASFALIGMKNASPRLSENTVARYGPNVLTLANELTILRIVFVPLFVILLVYNRLGWALITFLVAALTDGLDGLIARRFGQKTSVGAILDPIADKLLMSSSIVVLSLPQMEFVNAIPIWLLLLVIFRDVFILLGGLAFILMHGFRVFPPTFVGKASTMFQFLTVFAVLCYNWAGIEQPGLYFLFIVTGLLTVLSGFQYVAVWWRLQEH
jgi:cardiolipin synthase